jgi:hypothetical protein
VETALAARSTPRASRAHEGSARHGRMVRRAARGRGDGRGALTGAPQGSDEGDGGGGRQCPWSSSCAQGHGEEQLGLLGGGRDGLAKRLTVKEQWRRRDDGAGARRRARRPVLGGMSFSAPRECRGTCSTVRESAEESCRRAPPNREAGEGGSAHTGGKTPTSGGLSGH